MIDLIGDVHGHADELEQLLKKIGYTKVNEHYFHPDRKAIFVGDYIDRGPKIRETLQIVKQMVDNESAIALLGNHEYNALGFHTINPNGGYLREHSVKNILQHYETIRQFKNKEDELKMYLEWFKTLPLFYETEKIRAVHACWDYKSIACLKKHLDNNRITGDLIHETVKPGTELYEAIGITLKGKEIRTPNGSKFKDTDGNERSQMRIKWWEDPSQMTYNSICIHPLDGLPDTKIETSILKNKDYYEKDDKNVFFGHYWLKNKPSLYKENICCLDYSVAKEKGVLAAYSFDDEYSLSEEKFTYVPRL